MELCIVLIVLYVLAYSYNLLERRLQIRRDRRQPDYVSAGWLYERWACEHWKDGYRG